MYERHYWWVSQGATLEQSLKENTIWAPQADKRNRAWFYWDNVSKVKEGDIIFHYADGAIRAVSMATSNGQAAGRSLREGGRNSKGWRVNVEAHELAQPVSIQAIGPRLAALTLEKGPVNRSGSANPGFLYELPPEAVESIVEPMSLDNLPPELTDILAEWKVTTPANDGDLSSMLDAFHHDLAHSRLVFSKPFLLRFLTSLLAKPFVILTGLTGSGKTRLAQAFARWITPDEASYKVVAVGADWTSNENIVGYADRLNGGYVRTPALNLMLHAREHAETPHFLILDEMNLSHVERYFADLLSAIETREPITLHTESERINDVPPTLRLPDNLFIIGTVNVDETTYLFSPKVLDRANVIEFRASREQMAAYLDSAGGNISPDDSAGKGEAFGNTFVEAARSHPPELSEDEQWRLKAEVLLFFDALAPSSAEFGFRVANEIARFVAYYKQFFQESERSDSSSDDWFNTAMDAQIMQKLLPKLNGARSKLAPVLWSLSLLCRTQERPPITTDGYDESSDAWRDLQQALDNARKEIGDDPTIALKSDEASLRYPSSTHKLARMWRTLDQNGFVSFMEA